MADVHSLNSGVDYVSETFTGAANDATSLDGDDNSNSAYALSDQECFIHINDWFQHYGGNPCSKTETIYLNHCRSEEPVTSNMDISTGHIVLVSAASQLSTDSHICTSHPVSYY